MNHNREIDELWCLRLNPSDLYNIERTRDDNPQGGGGHTYIQIPVTQVDNLLSFLGNNYPQNGQTIALPVGNPMTPNLPIQGLDFKSKSGGRMRIANQNRHRQDRLNAWLPSNGFPTLEAGQTTPDAKVLLSRIGGLRIYIARDSNESVWAGYTMGEADEEQSRLPFSNILWGVNTRGGYWKYLG